VEQQGNTLHLYIKHIGGRTPSGRKIRLVALITATLVSVFSPLPFYDKELVLRAEGAEICKMELELKSHIRPDKPSFHI